MLGERKEVEKGAEEREEGRERREGLFSVLIFLAIQRFSGRAKDQTSGDSSQEVRIT